MKQPTDPPSNTPPPSEPQAPPDYRPNRIPLAHRILNSFCAAVIVLLGVWGLASGSLWLPTRNTRGSSSDLVGPPAWAMYAAMACACAVLLSVVADHYDRRDNEINYRRFVPIGTVLGWSFFLLSFVLKLMGLGQR